MGDLLGVGPVVQRNDVHRHDDGRCRVNMATAIIMATFVCVG